MSNVSTGMVMSSSMTTSSPSALMVACAEENIVEVRELLASDEVRINSTYDITEYSGTQFGLTATRSLCTLYVLYRLGQKVSLLIIAITLSTSKFPSNFHNFLAHIGAYITGNLQLEDV